MKNKILISLLIVSFFNYISCVSSYSSLNEEEIREGKPNPTESIKLILKNGVEYECVPLSENESDNFYYLKVDTAGIYVMGKGQVLMVLFMAMKWIRQKY